MTKAPFVPLNYAPAEVKVKYLKDRSIILSSPQKLISYPRSLAEILRYWAKAAPDRIFIAERDKNNNWHKLSYAQTLSTANSVSQALIDRGLKGNKGKKSSTILIISDNSVDHALLYLGAMQIGIPVSQIAPPYSLLSKDYAKLKFIFNILNPSVIYAADGNQYGKALKALNLDRCELVVSDNPLPGIKSSLFSDLAGTKPTNAVEKAFLKLGPDTIVKILFTSGSTDFPKGVINTQRMLVSNMQGFKQVWPFLGEKPPVFLDWLPWNHTFGSNHNFNLILYNGGTLYIDNGKATPQLVERTIANLKEVSPTIYFNVPRGFDMLLPYLERDRELCDSMFKNLDMLFYAGASLPHHLWERLEAVSVRTIGKRVHLASGWGLTETSPGILLVHFDIERTGNVGLPLPGIKLKLIPNLGKLEMRVKGPNVMPGYWKNEEMTKAAFDKNGFFITGDAGKFEDINDPLKGIIFDGRIGENFKLMSGTWVQVGNLLMTVIPACDPIVQDAVVTGHDREEIGLLIFPNIQGCKSLCPDIDDNISVEDLIKRPEVRKGLSDRFSAYNSKNNGNSTRIGRVLLMSQPASIDATEITAKGNLNQRAILTNRANLVEKLYSVNKSDPDVIILE